MQTQETGDLSVKSASSYTVEFYPSIDDLVYVSERLATSAPSPHLTTRLYQLFLIVNGIVFPSFLMFNGWPWWGFAVFVLNLLAILFLVPRVSGDNTRKYYNSLLPTYEDELEKVTIDNNGLTIKVRRSTSFIEWDEIVSIEENEESIFLFTKANGVAIRKSGFAYKEQEREMFTFAKAQLSANKKELKSKEEVW